MTLKSTNKCCTLCREPWLPKNLIVMKFVQMKFKWVYEGFKLKKKGPVTSQRKNSNLLNSRKLIDILKKLNIKKMINIKA